MTPMWVFFLSFVFFVGGMFFFLYSEGVQTRKEYRMINEAKGEASAAKREVAVERGRIDFLVGQRNKLFTQHNQIVETLKKLDIFMVEISNETKGLTGKFEGHDEELGKLFDNYSTMINLHREVSLKQDTLETRQPKLPEKIEIVFIDKPRNNVPQLEPKSGGDNEPKTKNSGPKETPKTNPRNKAGAPSLGRSYKSVERENSRRVSPTRKGDKGLNL